MKEKTVTFRDDYTKGCMQNFKDYDSKDNNLNTIGEINSNNEKNVRYREIDIIRGWAIFLVILGHAIALENIIEPRDEKMVYLFNLIYSFHMPLMFIVSGYCFKKKNFICVFIEKSKRLLVPYFFMCTVTTFLQALLPMLSVNDLTWGKKIRNIFLYGGDYWFLYVLFFIFMLVSGVVISINRNDRLTFIVMMLFLFTMYKLFINIEILCINRVFLYSIYFVLGLMLKQCFDIYGNKLKLQYILSGIIIFFIIQQIINWMIYKQIIKDKDIIVGLLNILFAVVGCVLSYYLSLLFSKFHFSNIFEWCGKHSLEMYLFNGYFIAIGRNIYSRFWSGESIYSNAIINLFFGIVINGIFCEFIIKVSLFRLFLGKRVK